MSSLAAEHQVAVIGAGTMGAGIAQVAAAAGHSVVLFDIADGAAVKGLASIRSGLAKLVAKGKMRQPQLDALIARISPTNQLESIVDSRLVIEVIVENLAIKRKVLSEIEVLSNQDTIIASNTSSISISSLAATLQRPENMVGMHFFNPAAVMKLVEVVSGLRTSPQTAQTIFDTARAWGKQPVHATSSPGFIVNRVARPFYAEALRSVTEQVATVASIDLLMRSCGGFKMGPLELIDLIGQDVNCAVTESVYSAYYQDKRFMPSVLQAEMVAAGLLGRKTGRGFYDYSSDHNSENSYANAQADLHPRSEVEQQLKLTVYGDLGSAQGLVSLIDDAGVVHQRIAGGPPRIEVGCAIIQLTDGRTASQRSAQQKDPNLVLLDYVSNYQQTECVALSPAKQASDQALLDAVAFFQQLHKQVCVIKDVPGMQVMRTISMLVNEAYDAVNQGVCDAESVDIAMQVGVAYPKGPIAWGQEIGIQYIVRVLQNLQHGYGEERYRVSPLLLDESY